MRSSLALRVFALLSATLLAFALPAPPTAGAHRTPALSTSVQGMTATVSGSWTWSGGRDSRSSNDDDDDRRGDEGDCSRWVGWQVDWGDPAAPGNEVRRGFAVGTASDNTIRTNRACADSGSTEPASHTYEDPGQYRVCLVMYEVRRNDVGRDGRYGTVAGGPDRNRHNSVEDGDASPDGPGCTSLTVQSEPNLVVGKTVDRSTASPGDSLTWTITVQNTGSTSATGVEVSDDIAAALARGTFTSASAGGSLDGTTVRWSNLTVPGGTTTSLSLRVRLNPSGWPSGTVAIPNTVVVPNSDCASGSSNAECRTSTGVTGVANLVVAKTVDRANASPGDSLTYRITIKNTGNAQATGVSVSDNIAALLSRGTFVAASNGGTLNGQTLAWSGLNVNQGSTLTLTFSVNLDRLGWSPGPTAVANTVAVPFSDCAPGSSNQACRVSTTVNASPNLVVKKAVNVASAEPGMLLAYTITLENTGGAPASGIEVTDDLSAILGHADFVTASAGGTLSGTVLRWSGLMVGVGSTVTLTFSVRLDTGGWGTGTTDLPNAVIVAGSDCRAGSSNGNCRANTSVVPRNALGVEKRVGQSQSGPFAKSLSTVAGEQVWYLIRLTNGGTADLTAVRLTDSMGALTGQCAGAPSALAVGATWSCTYSRIATEGTKTNTVTADSAQTEAVTDSATVTASPSPAPEIRLSKTASPTSLPAAGGSVTYSYVVGNPGNAPLSSVSVADDKCIPVRRISGDSNGNDRLDPSESWRFTCTMFLSATTTNEATAIGSFNGVAISAVDRVTVRLAVARPAIRVEVSAVPASLGVGGGAVVLSYVVTNPGDIPLSNVAVSDPLCAGTTLGSGDSNNNSRLDLSESWRYQCSVTLRETNTSRATASGSFGSVRVSDTDALRVAVAVNQPGIHVVTEASPTSLPAGGGSATYTYVVTNTGNTALTGVTVRDDRCEPVRFVSGDVDNDDRLDAPEAWRFRCAATLTATTTNTATASGTGNGQKVTDTDQATVAVTAASPGIRAVVTAAPIAMAAGGGDVTYSYVVTNRGNVPLSEVTIADNVCSPLKSSGGDADADERLDVTETWTYGCSTSISLTTSNTALVTAFWGGTRVTDRDQALVTVGDGAGRTPRITITTTADPTSLPSGGGPVTYTYVVSNSGNVALSDIAVSDDACEPLDLAAGDDENDAVLDVREAWSFTCEVTLTRATTSTAVVRAVYDGAEITASEETTVIVAPATPSSSAPGSSAPGATAAPASGQPGSSPGSSPPGGSAGAGVGASPAGSSVGSGQTASPDDSATPTDATGSSDGGPTGSGAGTGPTGSVLGAVSSAAPGGVPDFTASSTPSGMVMILILLLGIGATVLIMTLSKRGTNG